MLHPPATFAYRIARERVKFRLIDLPVYSLANVPNGLSHF
jgi:hypothetical protein